jgi:hypothetical protein
MNIFYSWQSDRPNKTNRTLIEEALNRAVRSINASGQHPQPIIVDRDTQEVPGAPHIAETILRKIDGAALVVADVTPVTSQPYPIPNPNVMFETGYALARLGPGRVITVLNDSYGAVETLPFDLGYRRALIYTLAETHEPSEARRRLERIFGEAINAALPATIVLGPAEDQLPQPDYRPEPGQEWLLRRMPLSAAQELWLKLKADAFETGVREPDHVLLRLHRERLGSNFRPEDVDQLLVTETGDITLVGLWHVDSSTPWLMRMDRFLRYVKQIISSNPAADLLGVHIVAKKLGMTHRELSHLLHLRVGPAWSQAGGNRDPAHYLTLHSSFNVGREHVFQYYEHYESLEKLIQSN